jgi:hypothetical protein
MNESIYDKKYQMSEPGDNIMSELNYIKKLESKQIFFNYHMSITDLVGNLLVFEIPLVSVYSMHNNPNPLIIAWADSDKWTQRYLIYDIDKQYLGSYLDGKICYHQLQKSALIYDVVDLDSEIISDCKCKEWYITKDLPVSYRPEKYTYFESHQTDPESIIKIKGTFGL